MAEINTMIETKTLTKTFSSAAGETHVLRGIDFIAQDGEFIAIQGRSGAGKSTFLYQISLLDDPSSGTIQIDGRDTHTMTPEEKAQFRLSTFGYVFQDYALLPELTALENVALPLQMQGRTKTDAYAHATDALTKVGLGTRLHNLPGQLSGGEQQRVAVARAIAHKPKILFADEPTANLDRESSKTVMNIFTQLHEEGQTIIMITHEEEYAKLAKKIITIDEGKIALVVV